MRETQQSAEEAIKCVKTGFFQRGNNAQKIFLSMGTFGRLGISCSETGVSEQGIREFRVPKPEFRNKGKIGVSEQGMKIFPFFWSTELFNGQFGQVGHADSGASGLLQPSRPG
jgi:hypothetical protein